MSRVYGGYQNNIGAVQDADGNVSIVAPTKTLIRSVPGYVRFDARAAYKIDKAITLSVNIQNLTDKTYFNQVYTSHYASIAPWRSAFATLEVGFCLTRTHPYRTSVVYVKVVTSRVHPGG